MKIVKRNPRGKLLKYIPYSHALPYTIHYNYTPYNLIHYMPINNHHAI